MLSKLDIFPSPVGVRIGDDCVYKSMFGGAMSIFAILSLSFLSLGTLLSFDLKGDQYRETIK